MLLLPALRTYLSEAYQALLCLYETMVEYFSFHILLFVSFDQAKVLTNLFLYTTLDRARR